MDERDRWLGMDRPITRRDFLQGVALAVGSRAARSRRPRPQDETATGRLAPPFRTGLRGQDPASTALGHRIRDGEIPSPDGAVEEDPPVDLVVVGAGLAGLATAFVYQRERAGRARVLLLDNHDDFGGHARRNTFESNGVRLVAPGGTFALEEPEHSPPAARQILDALGIDLDRLRAFRDRSVFERFGLAPAVFFDPRLWPGIRASWVRGFYRIPYEEFFGRSPLAEPVRRELVELYTTRKNYLAGEAEPEKVLASMSWERFIREKMGLGDAAVRFANLYATDLVGLGADAVSALSGFRVGPGFFGMGGEGFYEKDGLLRYGYEPVHRYPDGNHTIARHLLKKLVPEAVPGPDTMEGVFTSPVAYDRLDRPGAAVRVRLRSLALRVANEGGAAAPRGVVVDYLDAAGRARRVRAKGAVVAAWGAVAKHIVPELGDAQRRALDEYRYCSAVYINVLLRHWRPVAAIGAFEMYLPDGYCTWMHVSDPLVVGSYRPRYDPDAPTVLSMYKYLYRPGLPPDEQMRLGRYELEAKSFEEHEREIRSELNHALGPWGFDAARDILAITVNRWGHGYNFFWPRPGERPIYEVGRGAVGRISFAGADAGGTPWTQAAFEQAHRAAHEQLGFA